LEKIDDEKVVVSWRLYRQATAYFYKTNWAGIQMDKHFDKRSAVDYNCTHDC